MELAKETSAALQIPSHILSASLIADVGVLEATEAEHFVAQQYGIRGIASLLTSERDRNFRIQADNGRDYVFKIANPVENRDVTNFQTAALLHLERVAPTLPVQRIIATNSGETEPCITFADGISRVARLVSYIPGEVLRFSRRTPLQRRNAGRILADIGVALRDFCHPAAMHELAWDIKHVARLRALVPEIGGGPERRVTILRTLDNFDEHVVPRMPELRAQVVHNDLNRNNIIVDQNDHDRIVGVLDFGDMVHTQLINDVAIGASNQLADSGDPLDTVFDFIAGYNETVTLLPTEIDLLYDLISVRLAMSIIITEWRAERFPDRREHILRNTAANWARLDRLAAISRTDAISAVRRVCESR